MPKQTPKRNLLIVCEGTVTEPFYFRILADKAIEKGEWDNVRIIPEPRDLDNNDQQKDNKRPKRSFQNASVDVPKTTFLKADETEKKYLQSSDLIYPMPLGFVKEARDRLSEGAYDEAWVVFDKNGHPAQEAAFALAAETDKPVKIAFSSRSFEQWVLGHFEQSLTPFEATECKIRQKGKNIPLDCQGDKPLEGSCEGDKCLVGYIRKNYLSDYSKKGNKSIKSVFEKLSETESMDIAIINAAWLRAKQREILRGYKNKPYLLNPYTTVDVLVKRLLGITENIEWVELNTTIVLKGFPIKN
jgi:RloB-like protein